MKLTGKTKDQLQLELKHVQDAIVKEIEILRDTNHNFCKDYNEIGMEKDKAQNEHLKKYNEEYQAAENKKKELQSKLDKLDLEINAIEKDQNTAAVNNVKLPELKNKRAKVTNAIKEIQYPEKPGALNTSGYEKRLEKCEAEKNQKIAKLTKKIRELQSTADKLKVLWVNAKRSK